MIRRRSRTRPPYPAPWPPHRYNAEERWDFCAREERRKREGRQTYAEWCGLSAAKRKGRRNPEVVYWEQKLNNESRRGARRMHNAKRAALMSAGDRRDAEAFYQEVRSTPIVQCAYCRREIAGAEAHIDHVVPLARGGEHRRDNLAATCRPCNWRKGSKTVEEFRTSSASKTGNRRTHGVNRAKPSGTPNRVSRCKSTWAREELNLRPHAYQAHLTKVGAWLSVYKIRGFRAHAIFAAKIECGLFRHRNVHTAYTAKLSPCQSRTARATSIEMAGGAR